MDVTTIRSMIAYDSWANARVLDCCEQLTTAQFIQEDETPWGSIRDQFVHYFLIERRWLSWADGSLSGEDAYGLQADPLDYPDLTAVRQMWQENDVQMQAFMNQLTGSTLERSLEVEWPGFAFSVPIWQVLIHISQHSMQHRTEITVASSKLGASPGDLDYLFFVLE